jgi:hypothetical protein
MNPFVNLNKRGILLPSGCKDLMDALQLSKRQQEVGCATPVVQPEVQVSELAQVPRYLARLTAPSAEPRVLMIASLDAEMRVILEPGAGGLDIFPAMGLADRERDVEEFFAARAVQPSVDFLVGHPGTPTRVLGFPLPSDPHLAAGLTIDLIRSIYGLDAEAEVEFTYLKTAAA